jgi:hypothetical protein
MSKKRKNVGDGQPPKRQNPIHVRFGKPDMDDYEELYRRFEASGVRSISTYVKQLLSRVLSPDPFSEQAVRELLRELGATTSAVYKRVERLDSRTQKLRESTAKGVAHLLAEAAGWPPERAEKWVQEKLLR